MGESLEGLDPEILGTTMTYPVTVGQARTFMKGIIEEEFVWEELDRQGMWGGHLHRAVLKIALLEEDEDFEVDIIPLYVDEYIKAPSGWVRDYSERRLKDFSQRNIVHVVTDIRALDEHYEERRDHGLEELEAAFSYFNQSELPPYIMDAFDRETNARLRDKYFYGRNGLTGERYEPPEYPEYANSPIPPPEQV